MLRLCALIGLLTVALVAQGQTRSAIQSQYDRYAKAYVANDFTTILGILTSDYTLTNEDGKIVTRTAYEVQLKQRKKKGQNANKYTVTIDSLSLAGSTATVLTRETTTSPDGSKHLHRYRDVWRKVGRAWKLASTTTLGHG